MGTLAENVAQLDTLEYSAPQSYVNSILIPASVGWGLQIFLGGFSIAQALPLLHARKRNGSLQSFAIPGARLLLLLATLANLVCVGITYWEFSAYLLEQSRSSDGLGKFKFADVLAPLASALPGVFTQIFLTIRCWRVAHRSIVFAVGVSLGIAVALAGAAWGTARQVAFFQHYQAPHEAYLPMYLPMKIWLWTNVAVDIVIVTALTYNLVGMRRGFNKKTDDLINSLIRLSFETCAMPLFVALFSAILYEIASHPSMKTVGNWTSAPITILPSVYLISFVYCLKANRIRQRQSDFDEPAMRRKTEDGRHGRRIPSFRPTLEGRKNSSSSTQSSSHAPLPPSMHFNPTFSASWEAPAAWECSSANDTEHPSNRPTRLHSAPFSMYALPELPMTAQGSSGSLIIPTEDSAGAGWHDSGPHVSVTVERKVDIC